jgi:peroxiredoxin
LLLTELVGRRLPAIALPSTSVEAVDLARLDRAVLYFYPGNLVCSPEDGYDSPVLDDAQHRAFADHWSDFLALNCKVFGVSTQSRHAQSDVASALGIGQPLLHDDSGRLARELGLPAFTLNNNVWYCRATLIVNGGSIIHGFYPLASVVQSAAQVVDWMRWRL